ncbi:MAG: hypothetical protein WC657_01765 [Candidatus Paceibacterota bacterium]
MINFYWSRPMVKDMCEQVVKYWEENTRLLPEVLKISGDVLLEVIDGIDECQRDLLASLRELCF